MLHGGGIGYFSTLSNVISCAAHPNLLILWYEEMKIYQTKMVSDIARHIGINLSEEQVIHT